MDNTNKEDLIAGHFGRENGFDNDVVTYDSELKRGWSVDLPNGFSSPYTTETNSPLASARRDYSGYSWVPSIDAKGNVIVTGRDNFASLLHFLRNNDLTEHQVLKLQRAFNSKRGNGDNPVVQVNLTSLLEGSFQLMTNAIRDAKKQNKPTPERDLAAWIRKDYSKEDLQYDWADDYNCYGSCFALMNEVELKAGIGAEYDKEEIFDAILLHEYVPVDEAEAIVGKTIVRFSNETQQAGALHGATYMGSDCGGNVYVFTKNGWSAGPAILQAKHYTIRDHYGTVSGIPYLYNDARREYQRLFGDIPEDLGFPHTSGFYNPRIIEVV